MHLLILIFSGNSLSRLEKNTLEKLAYLGRTLFELLFYYKVATYATREK